MIKEKINAKEIANAIYTGGGRSRDCDVVSNLKEKYNESFVEEVLNQLAIIEIDYLSKI